MDKVICTNCGADNMTNGKYCSRCGHALPVVTAEVKAETVQPPPAESKKKKLLRSIVVVIAFGLTYGIIDHFFFATPSIDKQLSIVANELNKNCPMMIDKETQFNNAVVLPDKIFQYNYTLVNMLKEAVDTVAIRNYLIPMVTNNTKTNPEMKYQRDNKITLQYYYKDKNGNYLLSFSISPEQYEN